MWDGSNGVSSFIHCATVPAPQYLFRSSFYNLVPTKASLSLENHVVLNPGYFIIPHVSNQYLSQNIKYAPSSLWSIGFVLWIVPLWNASDVPHSQTLKPCPLCQIIIVLSCYDSDILFDFLIFSPKLYLLSIDFISTNGVRPVGRIPRCKFTCDSSFAPLTQIQLLSNCRYLYY